MKTKAELTKALDELEASLPLLIEDNPDPGDFWMAFAGEADVIEDHAGEHEAMVRERIKAMLANHGRALVDADDAN